MKDHWVFIINPNAGKGKGEKDKERIFQILSEHNISFLPVITKYKNEANELISDFLSKGYRNFIIGGGDGTLNEAINGLFSQKICKTTDVKLAVVPIGTGNDWRRTYNISTDYKKSIGLIEKGIVRHQDIGCLTYNLNGEKKNHFFMNITGLGFDAVVVNKTNIQKEKRNIKGIGNNKIRYLFNLLIYLLKYKQTYCRINLNNELCQGKILSIAVCIGKYNGGGMMPAPDSITDDGLFDITVFQNIKKTDVIFHVAKLFNGKIFKFKKVKHFRAEELSIESNPDIQIEADGEVLGTTPAYFKIIPGSIKIIVPD